MNALELFEVIVALQVSTDLPVSVGQLQGVVSMSNPTIYRNLSRLIQQGYIVRLRHGFYIVNATDILSDLILCHQRYDSRKWIVAIHGEGSYLND